MAQQPIDLMRLMESQRRKVLLMAEGWAFPKECIANVTYYRAVSPDGWISLIDVKGLEEESAIEKAWGKRNEGAAAQFQLAEWLRKQGNEAGITWDKTEDKFCASVVSIKNGRPKEAYGNSPAEAVANWKLRWERETIPYE